MYEGIVAALCFGSFSKMSENAEKIQVSSLESQYRAEPPCLH